MHASNAKRGIPSLLAIGRPVFSHFLESRTSACVMVAWEDRCHSLKRFPLYLLFLSFYCWTQHHTVWKCPFGQLEPAVLAVALPSILPTCKPTCFGERGGRGKKAFLLCRHCSAAAKRVMCYQHCFNHKGKAQRHTGCCEVKSIPASTPSTSPLYGVLCRHSGKG